MKTQTAKVIEHESEEKSVLLDTTGKQMSAADIQPEKGLKQAVVQVPATGPTTMTFIQLAIEKGMGADEIAKFMDLHERHQANEARNQYFVGLAAFSENPPIVTKDKHNLQYDSNYASLENTVITLGRHLGKFGLKHHWQIDQSAGISVTCVLSHVAGHSEQVTISGPPDTSGKKNELQQIKSTITYLKLATLESITGTASAEGSVNDDGNNFGNTTISPEQAASLRDEVEALPNGDEGFFCNWLKKGLRSFDDMPERLLAKAQKAIAEQKKAKQ